MARKTVNYVVTTEGRDKGKVFVITEMPSAEIERWAMRLLIGLGKNGVSLPGVSVNSGFIAIAAILWTLIAQLPFEEADFLMNWMMQRVQINEGKICRDLAEDDIEEGETRLAIREEWGKLHSDFFVKGGRLIWNRFMASAVAALPTTSTSLPPSQP
jgi:hypothetical protein